MATAGTAGGLCAGIAVIVTVGERTFRQLLKVGFPRGYRLTAWSISQGPVYSPAMFFLHARRESGDLSALRKYATVSGWGKRQALTPTGSQGVMPSASEAAEFQQKWLPVKLSLLVLDRELCSNSIPDGSSLCRPLPVEATWCGRTFTNPTPLPISATQRPNAQAGK